jgi:hypothetical protein
MADGQITGASPAQLHPAGANGSGPKPTPDHVVILVHGIRDRARWHSEIRAALEEEGFVVEPTNYGRFGLFRFLPPIPHFRNRACNHVWNQIRVVKHKYPDSRLSIIAHSFGTYVVSRILQKNFDLVVHRVIFCGSVVAHTFQFEQFRERFANPILNEVGTRDMWPAVADSVTWGYGPAGTYGFRRPLVRDRWHSGAGHGFFLSSAFCKKFWVPFLKDGTIVPGDAKPEKVPLPLQILSMAKLKYAVLILLFLALLPSEIAASNAIIAVIDDSLGPRVDPHVVQLGRQIRDEFRQQQENIGRSQPGDFSTAKRLLAQLTKIDADNGDVPYFNEEISRIETPERFTAKSCVLPAAGQKTAEMAPDKAPDMAPYQQDFDVYLEREQRRHARSDAADPGSDACYDSLSDGYCLQRTAWVHHLLANDFYEEAQESKDVDIKNGKLALARGHAELARKYHHDNRDGFEQCIDTLILLTKIDEAIASLAKH